MNARLESSRMMEQNSSVDPDAALDFDGYKELGAWSGLSRGSMKIIGAGGGSSLQFVAVWGEQEILARISEASLSRVVSGVNLMPGTLADQIGDSELLLVFLRHFGCIFCREMVADIRAAKESDPDYPEVLFFFQGTPTEGRAFLRRDWPDVRAIADAEQVFYEDFGVNQGSFLQIFGPRAFLS
ncbi:hypothetical protein MK280_14165, partial [Myxococcota bacterium]|nr:hypothetical protein [Myxococcota bacterium]